MQSIIKFLRGLGSAGTALANVLVFLTTSWGIVVSATLGITAAIVGLAYNIASNPHVQVGVGTFVAALWTYIGFVVLADRRKPRLVRPYHDYQYGLTFEGIIPLLEKDNEEGALQFFFQLHNYSMGPIQYAIEHFDVRIGTRALPKWEKGKTVYMPRGAARTSGAVPFKKDDIKEFFGKRVNGTAELSITYGHPETQPVRRLKVTLDLYIFFSEAPPMGFNLNIIEEKDEPFNSP